MNKLDNLEQASNIVVNVLLIILFAVGIACGIKILFT